VEQTGERAICLHKVFLIHGVQILKNVNSRCFAGICQAGRDCQCPVNQSRYWWRQGLCLGGAQFPLMLPCNRTLGEKRLPGQVPSGCRGLPGCCWHHGTRWLSPSHVGRLSQVLFWLRDLLISLDRWNGSDPIFILG
jgi:hypothetical protein